MKNKKLIGIIGGVSCAEMPSSSNYEALDKKVVDSRSELAENIVDYYYL